MKEIRLIFVVVSIFLISTITTSDYESVMRLEPYQIEEQENIHWLNPFLENENIAGYLYMEDIISDVVMNSRSNNSYYLNKNRDDGYAVDGELFFSKESNTNSEIKLGDMNRIYGHKMLNGSKFGNLPFLLEPENKRPLFFFNKEGRHKFELTRAFKYLDGTENFETILETGISKNDYLEVITQNSIVSHIDHYDVEDKNILFLQTCENAWSDLRYVFVFVEVSND